MNILEFVNQYNLDDILSMEEKDRQFLALKDAWDLIKNQYWHEFDMDEIRNLFLKLIVYNSLITYQISGSGELRWEEFSQKIESDFWLLMDDFLLWNHGLERRYNLMINSKYNKRLYNIKTARLEKLSKFSLDPLIKYQFGILNLREDLWKAMSVPIYSKTICFAIKMYVYGLRIVFDQVFVCPMEIPIPVDSRIRKVFVSYFWALSDKEIITKAFEISKKTKIPSLHLDSLFWLKN